MRRSTGSRRFSRVAVLSAVLPVAIAGCGSARIDELPPPAQAEPSPAQQDQPIGRVMPRRPESVQPLVAPRRVAKLRDDALQVRLNPQARTLQLEDGPTGEPLDEIPVGVGPTQVACTPDGPCYVTDTVGDSVLVIRVAPDGRSLRLVRRVYVAGAPYALTVDAVRRRLWVTLTARNELVELGAHRRPHILRRHPTVQQPNGVRVDAASGDVTVIGLAPPQEQQIANPASPDRPS